MKKSQIILFSLVTACSLGIATITTAWAQLTLVSENKSSFTVVVPADAPTSVQNAASEFQKDIELATGVRLPLQKDSGEIKPPYISLGNTRLANIAGIKSEELADESFRIVTREGNLYILGPDTPDKGWTKNNGVSNGTANGVYVFLEDYLGVRWLMPGDVGRDVPEKKTPFVFPNLDRKQTPLFSIRHLGQLWEYADPVQKRSIEAWAQRQRLGGGTRLHYDHNMWQTVNKNRWNGKVDTPAVKALYQAHPEWFAMDATGKRPYPGSDKAKMETTNPELVRWFADRAIEYIKNNPRPETYSLSPSDGGGWSQSPQSKALYDPSPSNLYDPEAPAGAPGMSSLVLKWYHDIARIVAQEYPEGRLAGYIYASYVYPPTKVHMKLPDNFTPVICGIGTYGYGLYRKDNQQRWKEVMDAWTKVAPKDWYYYDLPNQLLRQFDYEVGTANFPGTTGIITPAAPDILNIIFPQLRKSHIKGAYIYGVPSWSNAALANYLLAKMEWDPTLDAAQVQQEWLHRAYGPQAGAVMEEFYRKLNGWLSDYYQNVTKSGNLLTRAMLRDVYAANYPEMEALLLKATSQPMNARQQQRLQLLVDNLIVLQWRLRNAGMLSPQLASSLQRNDVEINALLTRENAAFPPFPGATVSDRVYWNGPRALPWKVQLAPEVRPVAASDAVARLDEGQFLLHAAKTGDIRVTVQLVTQDAYFASYQVKNAAGAILQSGILNTRTPLVIPATAGETYTLFVAPRNTVNYQLRIDNAALATGSVQDGALVLSGAPAAVYVWFAPQKSPIGVMEEEGGIVIKKPFSGNLGKKIMEQYHTDVRVLHSLDEGWRFNPDPQNDGLQRGVIEANYDDSGWHDISPLNWWQMQGFPNYHGTAWYRVKFTAKPLKENERARIYFGAVDGNAVVYLNGKKLTEHILGSPETVYKGWDQPFSANVTGRLLPGENTLVVQVTSKSDKLASGIFKGVAIVAGQPK